MTVLDDPPVRRTTPNDPPPSSSLSPIVFVAMVGLVTAIVLGLIAIGIVALLNDEPAAAPAAAATTTLSVDLSEFAIDGNLSAPAGHVVIDVTNSGSVEHNIALVDPSIQGSNLAAGASEQLDLGELAPGTYEVICTIPGHAGSGMTAELTITDGAGAAAPAADAARCGTRRGRRRRHGRHGPQRDDRRGGEMDQMMVDSMLAYPAETDGVGNQLLDYTTCARRHEAVRADGRDHPVGGLAGQGRRCLDVQRHGARTDDQGRLSATRCGWSCTTRRRWAPTSTGTASTRRTRRTACRPTPRSRVDGRLVHLRVRRRPTGDRDVPRPPPRPDLGRQRDVRQLRRRRESDPVRAHDQRRHDPRGPRARRRDADGRQRRRRDRPDAERQELPGDGAGRRRTRATGSRSTTTTRA